MAHLVTQRALLRSKAGSTAITKDVPQVILFSTNFSRLGFGRLNTAPFLATKPHNIRFSQRRGGLHVSSDNSCAHSLRVAGEDGPGQTALQQWGKTIPKVGSRSLIFLPVPHVGALPVSVQGVLHCGAEAVGQTILATKHQSAEACNAKACENKY